MMRSKLRLRETLGLICLFLTIVALSITITINFRPLYLFDIQHLNILKDVEVDRVTLIKNYDHLMMYLNNPFEKTLVFPDFPMSDSAAFHFYEVKVLMNRLEVIGLVVLIGTIYLIYSTVKENDYRPFKWAGFTTLGLVFIVGGTAYVDFDGAFTMMHHILFNNNYWLINPDIDPIINIFPESYFVTLGIALFSLIGIGVLINLGIYFKHINCINTNK